MASKSETIIRNLLATAGIEVNGSQAWDIQIHNPNFYNRVLQNANLGLGESYMDGWWDCDAIDQFIDRVLRARLDEKVERNWRIGMHMLKSKLFNRQISKRAFQVGRQHYDLGNDLYVAMLDRRMNYTSAYWKKASNLEEAQEAKLDLVCRKIGLEPGMAVLELGCGWGSFAQYAAEKYDARVTGVTVSKEQVALGVEQCKGLPVELKLQDYREVSGQYDAVISIGIMEHVGYKNYATYMAVVNRCIKPGGIGFVHTIGGNQSAHSTNAWTDKYIFPNGMLPSIAQLGRALEKHFVMEDWHNFGPDYDKTLMAWYANFENSWPELKSRYDERFYRMWRYYLLSSAGSFRARNIQLWQIVFTRAGTPQPDCRVS
ncbi:MAG: cyclopropane fatty acyl phospholipid synthase [Candidatus Marinimicrobia bacterium]|nr:cyclopropane fatty acyl phospholipid synthase [Candidatus Neomarinimicrobiota bacterium]MCF7840759.1 cyclopropane fatty acyl phospholipid synthase [Candidatus Neomarinimicrobiota bacterium]MCF7902693.1 cyclopropane fatty acyl phospholipid synthase [Candidatus Neomarinimicrobiota bacterium]